MDTTVTCFSTLSHFSFLLWQSVKYFTQKFQYKLHYLVMTSVTSQRMVGNITISSRLISWHVQNREYPHIISDDNDNCIHWIFLPYKKASQSSFGIVSATFYFLPGMWVSLNANFRWKGTLPTNLFWYQKTRLNTLSCGVKISTVRSFSSQSMHVTDRQTDIITIPKTVQA